MKRSSALWLLLGSCAVIAGMLSSCQEAVATTSDPFGELSVRSLTFAEGVDEVAFAISNSGATLHCVNINPLGGTMTAGDSTLVSVSIDRAILDGLASGDAFYQASIEFTAPDLTPRTGHGSGFAAYGLFDQRRHACAASSVGRLHLRGRQRD